MAAAWIYGQLMKKPFRYFKTLSEIIRLEVLMYVRYPLSLCQIEDILPERGIDVCYETNGLGGTA